MEKEKEEGGGMAEEDWTGSTGAVGSSYRELLSPSLSRSLALALSPSLSLSLSPSRSLIIALYLFISAMP